MCAAFSALSPSADPAPPSCGCPTWPPLFRGCLWVSPFRSFFGCGCCGPWVLPLLPLLFCSSLLLLLATGASVHRRGRCIGVALRYINGTSCDCSFLFCVFPCCLLLFGCFFLWKGGTSTLHPYNTLRRLRRHSCPHCPPPNTIFGVAT